MISNIARFSVASDHLFDWKSNIIQN